MAAVAFDTMVLSALLHPSQSHPAAEEYRKRLAGRRVTHRRPVGRRRAPNRLARGRE
jgi:hypothetical protein